MNNKTKYRMYAVSSFICGIALTIAIMMSVYKHPNTNTDAVSKTETSKESDWYIQANFTKSLKLEGTQIPDCIVQSDSGITSLLTVVSKPTLVFRFFDGSCGECIQIEAGLLSQFTKDIAEEQLLLVGSFRNYHTLKAYNVANDICFPFIQTDLNTFLDWEPDYERKPYYFVLYPGGKTSHFFMAVPEYDNYTQIYLEGINRLLSEKL